MGSEICEASKRLSIKSSWTFQKPKLDSLNSLRTVGGGGRGGEAHSAEVAFVLRTQWPRLQFSFSRFQEIILDVAQ